jgi:hypothetical protein
VSGVPFHVTQTGEEEKGRKIQIARMKKHHVLEVEEGIGVRSDGAKF